MTDNFMTYLEAYTTTDKDKKRELARRVDKALVYELDGKDIPVRELLLSESVEESALVQAELYNTLIEGSEPAVAMRNAVMVIPAKSSNFTITTGETGSYAPRVAEGSEIPISTQNYTANSVTIHKYGERPLITREMVEDSNFGLINLEVQKAGRRLENSLNHYSLGTFLDGSGAETDRAGSDLGVKAVAQAIATTKGNGFIPTDAILHPAAEGRILTDLTSVGSYFPVGTAATNGQFPQILGLKAHVVGTTTSSSSYTWGYAADGNMGMLIIDRYSAGAIAMRQDIRAEEYKDPIHDLMGMNVTMRFGTTALVANAATRVEY